MDKKGFGERPFQVTGRAWKRLRYKESVFHYISTIVKLECIVDVTVAELWMEVENFSI